MVFRWSSFKFTATVVAGLFVHHNCLSCPTPSRLSSYRFFAFNVILQSRLDPKADLFTGISAMQENGLAGKNFTRTNFFNPYFNLRYLIKGDLLKKYFQKLYIGAYAQWPLSFSGNLMYRDAGSQVIKGIYLQHLCRIGGIRFSTSMSYQSNDHEMPYSFHSIPSVHLSTNQGDARLIPVVHTGAIVKKIPRLDRLKNIHAGTHVYQITNGTEFYFKNTSLNLSHHWHLDGVNNFKKGSGYFSGTITCWI